MKYSEEEKTMWLDDWRQSGMSAWAYAKGNKLNLQTFKKWTKEKAEVKPCFVEVPMSIMPSPTRTLEILIERGDVKIHIPVDIGQRELRLVMEGLGAAL